MKLTNLELDNWQTKVLESNAKRILVCAARRTGKSTIAALKAICRAEGYPGSLVLLITIFPPVLLARDIAMASGATFSNSGRISLGNRSEIRVLRPNANSLRGIPADYVVLDEAAFMDDELFSVLPKVDLLAISSPNNTKGWFHRNWVDGDFEKYHVSFAVCPRINQEVLEVLHDKLPEPVFRRELLATY